MKRMLKSLSLACACLLPFSALAAQKGSTNEYPIGITMGTPTALMAPPGFYLIVKPTISGGDSVNDDGDKTGTRVTSWASNAQIMWVHQGTLLGAHWASFVRNIGLVSVRIRLPNGRTLTGKGLPDTEIVPMELSWKLGGGFYASSGFGFYVPDGKYHGQVAIGQNEWTFEPDFSLGYVDQDWLFNVHGVFNFNTPNHATHYRNGTTLDVDYTAFRKEGNLAFGLVGYYFSQVGSDSGPQALNGGRPKAFSTGLGGSYRMGRLSVTVDLTKELYTRNLSHKGMLLTMFSYQL